MKKLWIVVFGLLWMLVSCTPAAMDEAPPATPEPTRDLTLAPVMEVTAQPMATPANPAPMNETLQNLVERAKDDLSVRTGIAITAINLIQADSVNWSDGSLGCPQPGMDYAQVITPGYLIRLEANGVSFDYHASRGTEVVYCKNPQPPAAGIPSDQ